MRIVTVVGARPQFIKAGTVSRVLAARGLEETLVHTGQHFDANMSDIFFEELSLPTPSYNLEVSGGPHGQMTGRQLEKVEQVLLDVQPELVLVYGDTNSTLAGALAAAKLSIPVAHVEAGLRSWNRTMPEEVNRVLTDHVSGLLFPPTRTAFDNLRAEGFGQERIHLVGDVMYDAALFYRDRARRPTSDLPNGDFVLATVHRPHNIDNVSRLRGIVEGLAEAASPVVWPVHPRANRRLSELGSLPPNLWLIDPVGYLEMVWLESHCRAVATDSGGVQKEAYFHGKPCATLREETEWVELVEAGHQRLVGADPTSIAGALRDLPAPPSGDGLYGTGNASERIADVLAAYRAGA